MKNIYSNSNEVFSKFLALFHYTEATNFETSPFENEDKIFDLLVENGRFLGEANEAKSQLRNNPSNFTDFTQKYSGLIE